MIVNCAHRVVAVRAVSGTTIEANVRPCSCSPSLKPSNMFLAAQRRENRRTRHARENATSERPEERTRHKQTSIRAVADTGNVGARADRHVAAALVVARRHVPEYMKMRGARQKSRRVAAELHDRSLLAAHASLVRYVLGDLGERDRLTRRVVDHDDCVRDVLPWPQAWYQMQVELLLRTARTTHSTDIIFLASSSALRVAATRQPARETRAT